MSMNPRCQQCGMEDAEVVHCTGCACAEVERLKAELRRCDGHNAREMALRAELDEMRAINLGQVESFRSQRDALRAEVEAVRDLGYSTAAQAELASLRAQVERLTFEATRRDATSKVFADEARAAFEATFRSCEFTLAEAREYGKGMAVRASVAEAQVERLTAAMQESIRGCCAPHRDPKCAGCAPLISALKETP